MISYSLQGVFIIYRGEGWEKHGGGLFVFGLDQQGGHVIFLSLVGRLCKSCLFVCLFYKRLLTKQLHLVLNFQHFPTTEGSNIPLRHINSRLSGQLIFTQNSRQAGRYWLTCSVAISCFFKQRLLTKWLHLRVEFSIFFNI